MAAATYSYYCCHSSHRLGLKKEEEGFKAGLSLP
jgi:hypothetical protein